MDQKLITYIKKGLSQGFSPSHIKDLLLNKGINEEKIDEYLDVVLGLKKKQRIKLFAVLAVIIIAVIFIFSLEQKTVVEQQEVIQEKEQTTQEYLDAIGQLSEEIDLKEKTIDQKLTMIGDLNLTIEQRNEIINEIQDIYVQVKIERNETRDMLIQLLRDIVERGNNAEEDADFGRTLLNNMEEESIEK